MSEERRPPEDHGWRGLASGGWAAGPVGLIVPEARAGWMQSRRRNWVAVAAANRKGRNRPAGWREVARLVASLARTRVTSARARIARCGLKAQLRVVSCVRGRCFAVVSLRRSLRFFGRGRALACLSLHVRARAVPVRRVTTCAAEFLGGVAADGRGRGRGTGVGASCPLNFTPAVAAWFGGIKDLFPRVWRTRPEATPPMCARANRRTSPRRQV